MIVFNTGGIVVICMIIENFKYDLLIFVLIIVSNSVIRDLHGTNVKNVYSKENKQLSIPVFEILSYSRLGTIFSEQKN